MSRATTNNNGKKRARLTKYPDIDHTFATLNAVVPGDGANTHTQTSRQTKRSRMCKRGYLIGWWLGHGYLIGWWLGHVSCLVVLLINGLIGTLPRMYSDNLASQFVEGGIPVSTGKGK